MANHRAKGEEYMRKIARLGGLKSGETRHRKKVAKLLGIPPVPAELVKREKRSGGSHHNDWPCPYCGHVNSMKRQACAECGKTPANGRMTKAARLARAAEHRTQAILRKHGL
jgi:ribosomal protein L37AE/L43A